MDAPSVAQAAPPAPAASHPAGGRFDLAITGMTCAACVGRVEKVLKRVPGVTAATVNLATERAHVTGGMADAAALLRAVEKAGYGAREILPDAPPAPKRDDRREQAALIAAALLSAPLVLGMVMPSAMLPGWGQFIVASVVQFGFGARFYRAAWHAVRAFSGNMDLLVALGTSAAWGLSTWTLLTAPHAHHLYFESSALLITFVLIGKYLEAQARRGTAAAIAALTRLRPDTARVERFGIVADIPTQEVRVGDVVLVRPGERIPIDGRILDGLAAIDAAMLTGESVPVTHGPGQSVSAGTIATDGALRIETTAVGGETMLARIVRVVETAQEMKPPVQRLADRVSAVFVPVVLAIAGVTMLGWLLAGAAVSVAVMNAVAVLVIACPCALGLATPTAIMAGTGVAARQGILIRDGAALEQARAVRIVVFDKTGTLTLGKPHLVRIDPVDHLADAAALLAGSEHPLAAAVRAAAEHAPGCDGMAGSARGQTGGVQAGGMQASGVQANSRPAGAVQAGGMRANAVPAGATDGPRTSGLVLPPVSDFRALPGLGCAGTVAGRRMILGSANLLAQHDIAVPPAGDGAETLSYLAVLDGVPSLLATLAFADSIKPSARAAIDRLRGMGLRTVMLTGDAAAPARAVGAACGISDIIAGVLPAAKAEVLARLRRGEDARPDDHSRRGDGPHLGGAVAMVGDGINDAPALAAADIGIAMGTGSDVAMETAGITLMRSDLGLVAEAIDISRHTVGKIRQGLFWAFAYNVLGIPLAAMGYLSPVIAGAAMALSSVSVVCNALLLRRRKPFTVS